MRWTGSLPGGKAKGLLKSQVQVRNLFTLMLLQWGQMPLCLGEGTNTPVMSHVDNATQTGGEQDPIEKAVTLQLGTLLTALNELVQTALLPGTCTITLLRGLSRTYSILTMLVKYVRTGPLISA